MALPWVRLDANFASHDKVLALIADPSPARWQALSSYVCALGWSGAHGTDGAVPRSALPFVHGTPKTARLLQTYGLWEATTAGWAIRNYESRQELEVISAAKRAAQQIGARKANCRRWHGSECGCWNTDGGVTAE